MSEVTPIGTMSGEDAVKWLQRAVRIAQMITEFTPNVTDDKVTLFIDGLAKEPWMAAFLDSMMKRFAAGNPVTEEQAKAMMSAFGG